MEYRKGVCSIVIPVYNRKSTIAETFASCLAQDYPQVEVILVDDGSTDGSLALCEALASESNTGTKSVRVAHQNNSGACVARNRGMSLATGEFLLFLDSDDLIPPNKLSKQIAAMELEGADCCISDYETVDASARPLAVYRNNLAPLDFIKRFKSPSNSAIIMRRSSLPDRLQWNTSLKRMQDFDFMLRYLSGVTTWAYVPEPLYQYRLHDGPRISDSYKEGMPYKEMFLSMAAHLRFQSSAFYLRIALLGYYGRALTGSYLNDMASRLLPDAIKTKLKIFKYSF